MFCLFVCQCAHTYNMCVSEEVGQGIGFPETGVTDSHRHHMGAEKPNLDSLQKQQVV